MLVGHCRAPSIPISTVEHFAQLSRIGGFVSIHGGIDERASRVRSCTIALEIASSALCNLLLSSWDWSCTREFVARKFGFVIFCQII